MLDLIPYMNALVGAGVLTGLTWLVRPTAALRCFAIILAVWLAGYSYGELTGDFVHAPLNILTDALAARYILRRPAERMQAVLGGCFIIQLIIHGAFLLRVALTGSADEVVYYENLTIWAFIQLGVIGVWNGRIWWGRLSRHRAEDSVSPDPQGATGLGKAG